MIVKRIYLAVGIKYYDAYQGDPNEELIKMIIPANSEEEARETVKQHPEAMDELTSVKLIYELTEGCGWGKNGVWEVTEGVDSELIYFV